MSTAIPSPPDEDRLDRVFHALSDRTRRAVLARLAERPTRIGELAEPFSISLAAVSKHVRTLERAGLVHRSIDGRVHRCSLRARPLADADEWLDPYRRYWAHTLGALERYVDGDES